MEVVEVDVDVDVEVDMDVVDVDVLRVFVLLVAVEIEVVEVEVEVEVVVEVLVLVANFVRVLRVCGAENTKLKQTRKTKKALSCILSKRAKRIGYRERLSKDWIDGTKFNESAC